MPGTTPSSPAPPRRRRRRPPHHPRTDARFACLFSTIGLGLGLAGVAPVAAGAAPAWPLSLLLWPAANLLVLGCCYACDGDVGTRLLGKSVRTGALPWASVLFFLPFHLGHFAAWRLKHLCKGENPAEEVADGIWVGRYPLEIGIGDARFRGRPVSHVVDLTGEFPARAAFHGAEGVTYLCLPSLDRLLSSPERLAAAARVVHRDASCAFVHCANGHGRSGLFAGILLVLRGDAPDLDAAKRQMKRKRSVLNWQIHQQVVAERALELLQQQSVDRGGLGADGSRRAAAAAAAAAAKSGAPASTRVGASASARGDSDGTGGGDYGDDDGGGGGDDDGGGGGGGGGIFTVCHVHEVEVEDETSPLDETVSVADTLDRVKVRDLVSRWHRLLTAEDGGVAAGAGAGSPSGDRDHSAVTLDAAIRDAFVLCEHWPQGEGAGELLAEPVTDDTPVGDRGVSHKWLRAAWKRVKSLAVPTRVFAECFVPAVTARDQSALWFRIPPKYRGKPHCFVSHSWDGWLYHTFFLTDEVNGELKRSLVAAAAAAAAAGRRPDGATTSSSASSAGDDGLADDDEDDDDDDGAERQWCGASDGSHNHAHAVRRLGPDMLFSWLDVFAVTQHKSAVQSAEVGSIGTLVRDIGLTVLVLPGDGPTGFAIRPVFRTWCIYEIINTPEDRLVARAGLHLPLTDLDYHRCLCSSIASLSVEDARAFYPEDKARIDGLVVETMGSFENASAVVRAECLRAFRNRYAFVARLRGAATVDEYVKSRQRGSGVGDGGEGQQQGAAADALAKTEQEVLVVAKIYDDTLRALGQWTAARDGKWSLVADTRR